MDDAPRPERSAEPAPLPDAAAVAGAVARVAARWADPEHPPREAATARTLETHPEATVESITFAVNQTMSLLGEDALVAWQGGRRTSAPRTVGVLHAGNVPLGEVQDVLAVLLAGHRYRGVVSSRSPHLLPAFLDEVRAELPGLPAEIVAFDALFDGGTDLLLATGSDTTAALVAERAEAAGIGPERLLLRGHRVGVAVLDGRESEDEREHLAEDVLLHEGFGCRNVALVFAVGAVAVDPYLDALALGRGVFPAPKGAAGRLKMTAAFLRATKQPHASLSDDSLVLSRGAAEPQAPGHVRWVETARLDEAAAWIEAHADAVQVVAVREGLRARLAALLPTLAPALVALGETQRPPLDWRPDGTDTLGWLAARPAT